MSIDYTGAARPDDGGAAAAARERGSEVAAHAQGAAGEVAGNAKDRAMDVKDEALDRARDVYGEARRQLNDHANTQAQQVGTGLRQLGDELERMAQFGSDDGIAGGVVREGARRAQQAADFFEGRQLDDMLEDLRSVARRRPGAFLLGAAGLGLLAGRLARGMRDEQHDDSDDWRSDGTSRTGHITDTRAGAAWPATEPYPAAPTTPPTGYGTGGYATTLQEETNLQAGANDRLSGGPL